MAPPLVPPGADDEPTTTAEGTGSFHAASTQASPYTTPTQLLTRAASSSPSTHSNAVPLPVSTTANNVFGITELLERVLIHLEPADQIIAGQVCKTWNNLVKKSPQLRKSALPWTTPGTANGSLIWEKLDNKSFTPRLSFDHRPEEIRIGRMHPNVGRVVREHVTLPNKSDTQVEINAGKVLSWPSEEFWQKQYLFQPPMPISELKLWHGGQQSAFSAGCTLGDLFEVLTARQMASGVPLGMITACVENFLVDEHDYVKAARRFKAKEDAKTVEEAQTSKTLAEEDEAEEDPEAKESRKADEDRKADKAFAAVLPNQ